VALAAPARFDQVSSLAPRQHLRFEYTLTGNQRGWHEIGPATIEVGDVMALGVSERTVATGERLIVYPRIVPLSALGLPTRIPHGDLRARGIPIDDPTRYAGTREYAPGDSIRTIHWPITARTGRPHVRRVEPAKTLDTVIVLEMSLDGYDRGTWFHATELAIVIAASLTADLANRRQSVGLFTNGNEASGAEGSDLWLPPARGPGVTVSVLETLAKVQPHETSLIDQPLGDAMGRIPWGSTICIITGRETVALARVARRLRLAGFAAIVVLVAPDRRYSEDGSPCAAYRVPLQSVWRESDLSDFRFDRSSARDRTSTPS
jgi:uncharacterized protein (DUF58 family)